ncbi:MAG: hypothetical protein IKU07_01110 [Oscillospiraceae bacterium]|nr:hypothetical protein [Oscillospiraceae bacterium]
MNAIWGKGLQKEMNIHLLFQYDMTPQKGDVLKIAASNLYRFTVGTQLVGYGPARAAHGYSRVDVYDLTPWAGNEVQLTVEVYSANVGTYYTVDELPFFGAEIYRDGKCIAEAADFAACRMNGRVQKVQRYSFQRSFVESYRVTGAAFPKVETEAVSMNRLLPRYVSYPTLLPVAGQPVESGAVAADPTAEPRRDREYTDVDRVLIKGFLPSELEEDIAKEAAMLTFYPGQDIGGEALSGGQYRLYDFSRTVTGFFSFTAQVSEKTTLYILFDEVRQKEDRQPVNPFRARWCNVVKYKLVPGKYTLQNFEAYSARYAALVITEGAAKVEDFSMVRYENPDVKPLPDCGDEALNTIVEAAANSFAQNAVDILTDCPSRERAGWLCDSYFSGRAEHFFTGSNKVEKSFLENYALYTTQPGMAPGMLPMCYPADHPNGTYIPNWSMWYILELQRYVERTGDLEMKALSEQKVLNLLAFFEKYENEYGLLENLEGWVFIEWSKCNDPAYVAGINFPSNMLWAAALEAAAKLYGWSHLTEKAQKMRQRILALSYNGEFFEDNMVRDEKGEAVKTGHTTETCQYYAFYFGVATPESHPTLWQTLCSQFGPGRDREKVYPTVFPSNAIVGNYLRLELLLAQGEYAQVLQECKAFFLEMAALTGTLWEHSRLTASLNHGFASIAAMYIHQCLGK